MFDSLGNGDLKNYAEDTLEGLNSRKEQVSETYSEFDKMRSDPFSYLNKEADVKSQDYLEEKFEDAGVGMPEGWSADEVYQVAANEIEEKMPEKNPEEVRDTAIRTGLVLAGASAGPIGLDIAGAVVEQYEHNEDVDTWSQAGRNVGGELKLGLNPFS